MKYIVLLAIFAFFLAPCALGQQVEGEENKEVIIDKPIDALAKDIPAYVFPNSQLVSHGQVFEGLKLTSRQRSVFRTMFACPGTSIEVEEFYRTAHRKISISKINIEDFQVTKFKIDASEINSQVEIALYSFQLAKGDPLREKRKRQVRRKLQRLERPLQPIDQEIASLRKLFQENKVSHDLMERRIDELQRRRATMTNSNSYWDIVAMERSLVAEKNILLVTQVKKLDNSLD